ncbi:MAG: hypothetical protein FJ256_07430, partial [Phycisphaerae bacterium]|nr:hypothetical protein [Phycisphaerae bacterium]
MGSPAALEEESSSDDPDEECVRGWETRSRAPPARDAVAACAAELAREDAGRCGESSSRPSTMRKLPFGAAGGSYFGAWAAVGAVATGAER